MKKLVACLILLFVLALPARACGFFEWCCSLGNAHCCEVWGAGLAHGWNW